MKTPGQRAGCLAASALALLGLLAGPARPALAKDLVVKLKFQGEDAEERFFVPFERRRILAKDGVDLRILDGARLPIQVIDGKRIQVDLDGSGRFDTGLERGAMLALKTWRPGGDNQRHALRMVNDVYGRPCLEPACAQVGRLKGTPIAIVDADLNGSYADYGRDLMTLGKLPYAFPLSRTVVIGRAAYRIVVAEDGTSLTATALDEKPVKLDFTSELHGLDKPKMVVFRRQGEEAPDHVVAWRSPALLPAGDWSLAYAVFHDDLWALAGDAVKPIPVGEAPARWAWGAPFSLRGEAIVAEMGLHRTVDPPGVLKAPRLIEKTVDGKHVVCDFPPQVVGRAGLRYVGNWQHAGTGGVSLPDKRVPYFVVEITKDGRQLNGDLARWAPYDLSGLVKKKPVFWTSFEWPVGAVRGALEVTFHCISRTFGGALRSEPLHIEVK